MIESRGGLLGWGEGDVPGWEPFFPQVVTGFDVDDLVPPDPCDPQASAFPNISGF